MTGGGGGATLWARVARRTALARSLALVAIGAAVAVQTSTGFSLREFAAFLGAFISGQANFDAVPPGFFDVDAHADLGGLPAICLLYRRPDSPPSETQWSWGWEGLPVGVDRSEAMLSDECPCAVLVQPFSAQVAAVVGNVTATIAPGVTQALEFLFSAELTLTPGIREHLGNGHVFTWTISVAATSRRLLTIVVRDVGTEPAEWTSPHESGGTRSWGGGSLDVDFWRESAGSDAHALDPGDGGGGGGGGGGSTDLTPVVEALEELVAETKRVADQRTTIALNHGSVIYSVNPAEIIEED